MILGLCRPESCTWVVSGIYVKVVVYMVKLARHGIVKLVWYGTEIVSFVSSFGFISLSFII